MNRDNLAQLIRAISEAPAHSLDLDSFHNASDECGTTYCIAGFAQRLSHPDLKSFTHAYWKAWAWLELTNDEAFELFLAYPTQFEHHATDPHEVKRTVLNVLNHLLETGTVDWELYTKDQTP